MKDKKQRILVVDDTPGNIRAIIEVLGRDYAISVATNGHDALRVARLKKPDMILLDVVMPCMDGLEVCKRLKSDLEVCDIPVIFVTGKDHASDEAEGLAAGAIDYIVKPFNPLVVEARIKNHMKHHQAEKIIHELHNRNHCILDAAGEGIYGVDLEGKTTFINPAATMITGWEPHELIGKHQHDILHHTRSCGSPYPREECAIYSVLQDGETCKVEDELFWRKDGTSFPVEYTCTPIRDESGVRGAVVVFRDIGQKKEFLKKERNSQSSRIAISALLETSLERLSLTRQLEVALDIILAVSWLSVEFKGAIFLVDEETGELVLTVQKNLSVPLLKLCSRISPGYCLCGLAAQKKQLVFASAMDEEHAVRFEGIHDHGHYCVPILSNARLLGVLTLYLPFGHVYDPDEEAFLSSAVNTLASIIEHRQLEERLNKAREQLDYWARHDKLTDLPNRMMFQECLSQDIMRARRHKEQLAVFFVDLDRFKQVNDTLGHKVGDLLLIEVGRRIKSLLRAVDTVARIGGDEFTVILPEISQEKDATMVAEKIVRALQSPIDIEGNACQIGSSIGISLFPLHGDNPDILMKRADDAMYAVKKRGRNDLLVFHPELEKNRPL